MAGTFNTTFLSEIILKLPELNHSTEILVKYHLTDKVLNYNLIISRDIVHEPSKIKQSLGKKFQFQLNHQTERQKISV